MVLVAIEASDVVFALDSIPAVFGVTPDPFIVFTSNIFAVLGLRALYFSWRALSAASLPQGRPWRVLAFVGAKMLIGDKVHISDVVSLLVVTGLIGAGGAGCPSFFRQRIKLSRAVWKGRGAPPGPGPGRRSPAARARSPRGRRTRQ